MVAGLARGIRVMCRSPSPGVRYTTRDIRVDSRGFFSTDSTQFVWSFLAAWISRGFCVISTGYHYSRPQIPLEHLRFLLEKKFKVAENANLFGSSKRTVERRMKDFGLSAATTYTQLLDQQLDELIRDIQRDFPNAGCERVTGLLRARDVYMQQARIRQSMRRVDPEGILLRALELNTIRRRQYSVAGPLSLWHIDGNHKLIRYVVGGERRINVTAFHRVISLLIGRIEQRNSSTYKSSYSTILVLIL